MVKGDTPAQDRIDKIDFEKLCGLMCTEVEIADFFDVDEDTLNTWCKKTYGGTFSETFKKKCSPGKITLRRIQLKQAEKNPTMAIWLGKQWLGQTDKIDTTTSIEGQPKLEVEIVDNENLKEVMYEEEDK